MKKFSFIALLAIAASALLLTACGGDSKASSAEPAANAAAAGPTTDPNVYTHPELLVETNQIEKLAADAKVTVVDVRAKEKYDAGHVPGAVWYDPALLKDPDDKYYVIRPEKFGENLGNIGISNGRKVIVYDDGNGLSATRFWWVYWYYGGEGSVVNGGWAKYAKDGLAVSKDAPAVTKAVYKATANTDVICALDYVEQKSNNPDPNVVILDVRSAGEYNGSDVRAAKGGHVPNAVNLDWTRTLTEGQPQVWKSAAELRKQFAEAGVKPGAQVITYCQTGVRAAHSLFTLRLLGYEGLKNFDGSWQEWGNSKNTKVAQ